MDNTFNIEKFITNVKKAPRVPKNSLRVAHLIEWSSTRECLINNKALAGLKIDDIESAIEAVESYRDGNKSSKNIMNNMVVSKSFKVIVEAMKGNINAVNDEDYF